jgi:CubicO group peptidase (beta-lactamase class C family)
MRDGTIVPPCETDSPGASAIYASAHDLIRFAMLHLKTPLPDQRVILGDAAVDKMKQPSLETGPLRAWEQNGSGYGIGWFVGITRDGLRVVQHSGGTLGVSTILALVPDHRLAVVVLSNTDSPWPDVIAIETLCTLLSYPPEAFLPVADKTAQESDSVLPSEWAGTWQGNIHTYEGNAPLSLEISADGAIYATLGEQPRTLLQQVSYRDSLPQFMNAGGGPYLRGSTTKNLDTEDMARGAPYKLWLELKHRDGQLAGVLVAFSQKTLYTGPLSHWVTLDRLPP